MSKITQVEAENAEGEEERLVDEAEGGEEAAAKGTAEEDEEEEEDRPSAIVGKEADAVKGKQVRGRLSIDFVTCS